VESVQKNGWAGIKNGELLTPAELSFDVFITMDGNIEFQQNYPPCHWGRHVANLRDETDRGL